MGTGARWDPAGTWLVKGGAGGMLTVGAGAAGAGAQSRDLTFKSPESFRPRTFLFDLEKRGHRSNE